LGKLSGEKKGHVTAASSIPEFPRQSTGDLIGVLTFRKRLRVGVAFAITHRLANMIGQRHNAVFNPGPTR
jgi:hypothetical protein